MLAPIPAPWKNAVAAVPRATAVSSAEDAAFLLRSGTRTGSGGSISKSGRTGASERANERELWHGRRLRVGAIEERARAAGKKVNWRERGGRRKGKRKKLKITLYCCCCCFYTPPPPLPPPPPLSFFHAPLPASLLRCSSVLITSITDRCGLWYIRASSACLLAAASSLRPAENARSAGELAAPSPAAVAAAVVASVAVAASRKRSLARRRMYSRML